MQRRHILAAVVVALGAGTALPSLAQPRDERDDHHDRRGPEYRDRDAREYGHREGPVEARRGHGEWEREMRGRSYVGARGPEWHRGGRIPAEYRDHVYVVNNWRAHRLAPPPRGYEWVQVGPDYVLVTVRTGVIAQIVVIG